MTNPYVERFEQHGLWAEASALSEHVDGFPAPDDDALRADLERLQWLSSQLQTRRQSTNPLAVTEPALTQAQAIVNAVRVNLDNLTGDDPTPLSAAASRVDEAIVAMSTWPPLPTEAASGADLEALSKHRASMAAAVQQLVDQRDALAAQLAELKTSADALREEIDSEKNRLEEVVAAFAADSAAKIEEIVTEDRPKLAAAAVAWDEAKGKQLSDGQSVLDRLAALEKEARDTVHATAAVTVATDYGKYARNKTVAAWLCDLAAAVVGTAGVAAILRHLYAADPGADSDIGLSLTRLAASLGTLGIAALIGKRGAQHHREARAAKRADLALQKVNPFIATLPTDVRQDVIEDMTQRVFIEGRLDDPHRQDGRDEPFLGRLAQRRASRPARDQE